jgi:NAD(P)H-hydrate epimerase
VKITTAAEMNAIDRATSARHGVPSLALMENAGAALADFACEHWPHASRIVIVCGRGNNGGDGLVAARRLHAAGKVVEVLLLGASDGLKPDAAAMLERLPVHPVIATSADQVARECAAMLAGAELIIDAIFGTGYTVRPGRTPAQSLAEAVIAAINAAAAPVLSVDLPSGWDADAAVPPGPVCRSSAVVTFTAPKPAHLLAPLTRGPIVVAPIGTPESAIISAQNLFAISPRELSELFAPRPLDSNKGRFGHVLVAAGSVGKSGAAAMCGMAALRVGAGLVTVATPTLAQPAVAGFAPELMTEPQGAPQAASFAEADAASVLELAKARNVLAVGPGISQRPGAAAFVHRLLAGAALPVVLDADGLNAFAGRAQLLRRLARPLILTPHPGEMARLTGASVAEIQSNRLNAARDFARTHGCILVLKGFRTVVAYPRGELWIAATGNPGLATGGTGDILTGMIAGAVAQFPKRIDEAVRAAVYLHGLAGDVAASRIGEEAMVATDLLRFLPAAFRRMRRRAAAKITRLC